MRVRHRQTRSTTPPCAPQCRATSKTHPSSTPDQTRGDDYVFAGSSATNPFTASAVYRRVRVAWSAAGLSPINLHEARHTFASTAIAAGLNAKIIATYMGHSSIQVTYDLYGKLMPGNDAEAAALFEAYLAR
jgi:integrase